MKIVLVLVYFVGCAVGVAVIAYAALSISHTVRWYIKRRGIANRYDIWKGLTREEVELRLDAALDDLGSELTDNGEFSCYSCAVEGGSTLTFYFLDGRLYSWHADIEQATLDSSDRMG
jgi:hypothetical protein